MRKGTMFVGLALVGGLFLGACGGDDDFDRDAAVEEMMASGLDEATAGCLVDAMVEEFGEDVLGSDREPTAEELDAMSDITLSCMEEGGMLDDMVETTVAE